jgi:hypothetical protein
MSSLSAFTSWCSKYATWSDLKTWLQASEPSVEILEFEGSPYVILKTGKGEMTKEQELAEDSVSEAAQLCRSVVWDTRNNRPCSVAPFAARRDQKIPMNEELRLEDFVEGVMINVFRTKGDSHTNVTTRSRLDADGCFYSERTFRELFEEAMEAKRVCLDDIEGVMLEQASVKGSFVYDYTIQQQGGPMRHLRSLLAIKADGAASVLITLTAQCLEPKHAAVAATFKAIIESYAS